MRHQTVPSPPDAGRIGEAQTLEKPLLAEVRMRCRHLNQVEPQPARTPGCEECLRIGSPWVHLRLCLTCGHVGCCDSSPGRHATHHFHQTGDPLVASYEPGERWAWCYVDHEEVPVPDAAEPYLR